MRNESGDHTTPATTDTRHSRGHVRRTVPVFLEGTTCRVVEGFNSSTMQLYSSYKLYYLAYTQPTIHHSLLVYTSK